jgi:predicted N-acetyltransferase YhbS
VVRSKRCTTRSASWTCPKEALPAFNGWVELAEPWGREESRNRRIGARLVGHTASWLRLAECERNVISVEEIWRTKVVWTCFDA